MNLLEKALAKAIEKSEGTVLTPLDSCFSTRTPSQKAQNLIRYSKKYPHITVGLSIGGITTNYKNGKKI